MDRSGRRADQGGSPRVLRAARMSAPGPIPSAHASFGSRSAFPSFYQVPSPPIGVAAGSRAYSPPSSPRRSTRRKHNRAQQDEVTSDAATSAPTSAIPALTPVTAASRKPPPSSQGRKRKAPPTESSSAKKPCPKKKRAPARLKTDPDDDEQQQQDNCDSNCCICMTEPEPEELATINGCQHFFCFGCIEKWADRENTCPLCKTRFKTIERVHKPTAKKGVALPKASVKVKDKSQRSELATSLALEGLFGGSSIDRGIAFESFFARLGNSGVSTQIARIVVGGMRPRASLETSGPPVTRAARAAARSSSTNAAASSSSASMRRNTFSFPETVARMEDVLLGGDDDEDGDSEDDGGFSGFVDSIRQGRTGGATFTFRGFPPSMFMPAPPPPRPRSYAVNANDASAGASADNALEIQDDSDDDDEVQIVGSRRA